MRISRRTTSASSLPLLGARCTGDRARPAPSLLSGSASHHAPVGRDRLLDLAGLLLVDAGEAQQRVDLPARVLDLLQLRRRQGGQLGPVARSRRQPLQVREHVLVDRIDAQRARRRPRRPRSGATAAAPRARRCCDSSSTLAHRLVAVGLHHLVDGDHAIPLARALVDRLEHRARPAPARPCRPSARPAPQRRLVRRIHLPAPGGTPRRRASGPSGARATARRCGTAATTTSAGDGASSVCRSEHRQQVVPALGLHVQAIERLSARRSRRDRGP